MVRKMWIVAVLTVAGLAMTPDTAEAGRRRNKKNCCPQPCCNTCSTGCNTGCGGSYGGGYSGGMMGPVGVPTAPPPVAVPPPK